MADIYQLRVYPEDVEFNPVASMRYENEDVRDEIRRQVNLLDLTYQQQEGKMVDLSNYCNNGDLSAFFHQYYPQEEMP